jgi:hypothetical protein
MNHDLANKLRDLLREHPVEALVAIREAKLASEWRERTDTKRARWFERVSDGGVAAAFAYTDADGRSYFMVAAVDAYNRMREANTIEAAMAAADADLLAYGCALGSAP